MNVLHHLSIRSISSMTTYSLEPANANDSDGSMTASDERVKLYIPEINITKWPSVGRWKYREDQTADDIIPSHPYIDERNLLRSDRDLPCTRLLNTPENVNVRLDIGESETPPGSQNLSKYQVSVDHVDSRCVSENVFTSTPCAVVADPHSDGKFFRQALACSYVYDYEAFPPMIASMRSPCDVKIHCDALKGVNDTYVEDIKCLDEYNQCDIFESWIDRSKPSIQERCHKLFLKYPNHKFFAAFDVIQNQDGLAITRMVYPVKFFHEDNFDYEAYRPMIEQYGIRRIFGNKLVYEHLSVRSFIFQKYPYHDANNEKNACGEFDVVHCCGLLRP